MKKTIVTPSKVPTVNITVNKSRIKLYNKEVEIPTYYLQKGQEFEIELFNPTTDSVLAKISLNGKEISQGGLVVNPGQRVFLDRYFDVAKKFLFDTYEVSNTEEVKAAIQNNGDIKVSFYKENVRPIINITPNWIKSSYGDTYKLGDYNSGTDPRLLRGNITTNGLAGTSTIQTSSLNLSNSSGTVVGASFGATPTTSINSINYVHTSDFNVSDAVGSLTTSHSTGDGTLSFGEPEKSSRNVLRSKKSVETGRVDKGSDSNQEFKYVNKDFDYFAFHIVEYKLLPISQKVVTSEDINIKRYCTNCGAKLGKTDKFCSSCGTKA